jgi:hypothetical protein
MPLLRYFVIVGSCLLVLLFAADAYLPKSGGADTRVSRADATPVDLTTVRITSNKQTAPPIVYDTSRPTVIAQPAVVDTPTVAMPAADAPAVKEGPGVKDSVRNAYAQVDTAHAAQTEAVAASKVSKKRTASRKQQQRRRALAQAREPGFFDFW